MWLLKNGIARVTLFFPKYFLVLFYVELFTVAELCVARNYVCFAFFGRESVGGVGILRLNFFGFPNTSLNCVFSSNRCLEFMVNRLRTHTSFFLQRTFMGAIFAAQVWSHFKDVLLLMVLVHHVMCAVLIELHAFRRFFLSRLITGDRKLTHFHLLNRILGAVDYSVMAILCHMLLFSLEPITKLIIF